MITCMSVGHADGTNNNCLVESLITVLTEAEFLKPLTAQQRRLACSMNRSRLVNHDNESLRPADEQGNKCEEAYLEHDKHAEPTVRFLFAYCVVQGLVRPGNRNPENGFKLTVYSRADSNQIPASVVHICRGDTSSAEPYPLYLYNYLGERLRGVHYAPMHHLQVQAPMPQEEVDTPVPAAVAERERTRGGSADGNRSAGSVATMCVPAFASGVSRRCEAGSGTAADEHATTRKRSFCSMLGCVPARATVTSAEGEGSEASESSSDASEDSEEDGAGNHAEEDLCFEVQCRRDIRPEDMVERDLVRKRCLELREHMRQRPDLPCNSAQQPLSAEDIEKGVKLPLYSCPFVEGVDGPCTFATNNRNEFLHHICGGKQDKARTHVALLQRICPPDIEGMDNFAYVHEAMACAERERWPLRGLTTTRRALDLLAVRYNDQSIQCLCCFICGQLRTTCAGYDQVDLKAERPAAKHSNNTEIRYRTVDELVHVEKQCAGTLLNNCGEALWRQRYYAATAEEKTSAKYPWRGKELLHVPLSQCHADRERHVSQWMVEFHIDSHAGKLFGCTEDMQCDRDPAAHAQDYDAAPHYCRRLCKHCRMPVCEDCWAKLWQHNNKLAWKAGGTIPMSLANDHYYGHVHRVITKYDVTWLEMAACSTMWTTMLVYYLELPYGHLLNAKLGKPAARTAVRGNLYSYPLVMEDMNRSIAEALQYAAQAQQP